MLCLALGAYFVSAPGTARGSGHMREDREDPVNWLLLLRQGYIGKVLLNRNLVPVGERDPVPECARLGPHSLLLISDNHNTLSFPFFFPGVQHLSMDNARWRIIHCSTNHPSFVPNLLPI